MWVAIAVAVAVAVLTIVPGAWAGTALAKFAIWSIHHQILAALLGTYSPSFAIANIASKVGATAFGFWAVAGAGAVNSFIQSKGDQGKKDDSPSQGGGMRTIRREIERQQRRTNPPRPKVILPSGEEVKPNVPEDMRAYRGEQDTRLPEAKRGGDLGDYKLPENATKWQRFKFSMGLVVEWVSKLKGGGLTIPIGINPQIYCELDPTLPWCPKRSVML